MTAALFAIAFAVAATGFSCIAEQLAWRREDPSKLSVESIAYSPRGIALTVRSAEPVQEVLGPPSFRSFLPWCKVHEAIGFRSRILAPESEQILVEYEFVPGGEWLLALRSADGYWASMSPHFPSQPDLDQQTWRDLWSSAKPH